MPRLAYPMTGLRIENHEAESEEVKAGKGKDHIPVFPPVCG